MKTFPSRTSLFCLFLALCLAAAESAAAQSYKAEALSEPPPSELAAPVRNAVSATGIRVTGPSGALCDIWLGKAVPGKANAPQSVGLESRASRGSSQIASLGFPFGRRRSLARGISVAGPGRDRLTTSDGARCGRFRPRSLAGCPADQPDWANVFAPAPS